MRFDVQGYDVINADFFIARCLFRGCSFRVSNMDVLTVLFDNLSGLGKRMEQSDGAGDPPHGYERNSTVSSDLAEQHSIQEYARQ